LDLILIDTFGPDWLEWESETVWSEIEAEFGATPSVHSRNKINALKTMHIVDTPWTEWEVFNIVAQALNGNIPDFRILQKPSPLEVAFAVEVMRKVKEREFSSEIARFVAAAFLNEEIVYLPPPVEFAQVHASVPRYKCRKCGNYDTDDANNMCDLCGAPQSMLERSLQRDPTEVKQRYDHVSGLGRNRQFNLMETAIDIQVAKLIAMKEGLRQRDRLLREQTEATNG